MSEKLDIDKIIADGLKDNGVIIDVRTEEEYDEGHIPNSISIPLSHLDDILTEVIDKDTHLMVYCKSGIRSGNAVQALILMGYTNAVNAGGIIDWKGEIVS